LQCSEGCELWGYSEIEFHLFVMSFWVFNIIEFVIPRRVPVSSRYTVTNTERCRCSWPNGVCMLSLQAPTTRWVITVWDLNQSDLFYQALYTCACSWPHRAVVAGQTVSSVFLEGTWNTRRVLFSGFRYVLRMSRAFAKCVFCRSTRTLLLFWRYFHLWMLSDGGLIAIILKQRIYQLQPQE
jgi:hypothetical protein